MGRRGVGGLTCVCCFYLGGCARCGAWWVWTGGCASGTCGGASKCASSAASGPAPSSCPSTPPGKCKKQEPCVPQRALSAACMFSQLPLPQLRLLWFFASPLRASPGNVTDPFQKITMINLADGSQRLWVSAAFTMLFNLYALYTLDIEYRLFVGWRGEFLVNKNNTSVFIEGLTSSVCLPARVVRASGVDVLFYLSLKQADGDPDARGGKQLAYSVRVESLPANLQSDVALAGYFENLFPGQVRRGWVHKRRTKRRASWRSSACARPKEDHGAKEKKRSRHPSQPSIVPFFFVPRHTSRAATAALTGGLD